MNNIGWRKTNCFLWLVLVGAIGCTNKDPFTQIKGDLYFDTDRIGSFYGLPDSTIARIKKSIDSIQRLPDRSGNQEFLNVYEALNQHHVLYRPFVDVYIRGDSVVKLYIDSADYARLNNYSYHELIQQKKKVMITAKAQVIRKGYYTCIELQKVEMVAGETYPIDKQE